MSRTIRELPPSERPRQRIHDYGGMALSDAELLALIIQSGVPGANAVSIAQDLLVTFGGLSGLRQADILQLRNQAGIGAARAAMISATFELGRRLVLGDERTYQKIRSPNDAAQLLMLLIGDQIQEHMLVLCLNTKNMVIKTHTAYIGTVDCSQVRAAEMYREAVKLNAPAIIIAHNHPSGVVDPSPEDVLITRSLISAGQMLDIQLLDHLIIGHGTFLSLREKQPGLGWT